MGFTCRQALPKAKEQPADAADGSAYSSSASSAPSQATAAALSPSGQPKEAASSPRGDTAASGGVAAPVGGARKISAELPAPEEGGMFHGGPLTNRKKDTGGVGENCLCADVMR